MATRRRAGDVGADDARRLYTDVGREIRRARFSHGLSLEAAGRRAGFSGTQLGRIERNVIARPPLEQICRAARAVGLKPALPLYPDGAPIHDAAQLALLGRFEALLAPSLRLRREVPIPLPGDLRAWDGRIDDGDRVASVEGESKLNDAQALERRVRAKCRDDPGAGVVILVVNRTAHNRRVLGEHREALRAGFPLDGAAIARELRRGRVPGASGIILL
jgi:transcriptional regulator with XRE-family HTH domain